MEAKLWDSSHIINSHKRSKIQKSQDASLNKD